MSKLNKIISCLIPITTIGALAPVMVGCGKPAWNFKYGESINCLDNEKKHTDIASYQSLSAVYAAAKLHADKAPGEPLRLEDINGKKTLESVYFDLIASLCMSNIGFCINCELDDTPVSQKFTTFYIEYNGGQYDFADATVNTFVYNEHSNAGGSIDLTIGVGTPLTVPSYVYSECTVK